MCPPRIPSGIWRNPHGFWMIPVERVWLRDQPNYRMSVLWNGYRIGPESSMGTGICQNGTENGMENGIRSPVQWFICDGFRIRQVHVISANRQLIAARCDVAATLPRHHLPFLPPPSHHSTTTTTLPADHPLATHNPDDDDDDSDDDDDGDTWHVKENVQREGVGYEGGTQKMGGPYDHHYDQTTEAMWGVITATPMDPTVNPTMTTTRWRTSAATAANNGAAVMPTHTLSEQVEASGWPSAHHNHFRHATTATATTWKHDPVLPRRSDVA
ncbi:hypothetical protein BDZ97DRAFT_1766287 [Flammula alnicola]|nr:hypothetical protein BDZ97DRAFT_1766287 [Flammula alnicola]